MKKSYKSEFIGFVFVGLVVVLAGCAQPTTPAATTPAATTPTATTPTASVVKVESTYNFVADKTDTVAPKVLNTIPAAGTTATEPGAPVVMYFDDIIDPSTISDTSLQVTSTTTSTPSMRAVTTTVVYGTVSVTKSANGSAAIVMFTAFGNFPSNSTIKIVVTKGGILDKGGNSLSADNTISFTTGTATTTTASVLDFESGTTGIAFSGCGSIVTMPKWGIPVMTGTHAAAISTGYSSDISSVNPISDQYSTMTTGSIAVPSGKTKVTLDYYFVSDEFKEYLGSKYDDNATFTVSGSGGSRNIVLNSVNNWNTTALSATLVQVTALSSSWWRGPLTTKSIDITGLGSNISISLTVSDVGDKSLDTILLFDNLRFE